MISFGFEGKLYIFIDFTEDINKFKLFLFFFKIPKVSSMYIFSERGALNFLFVAVFMDSFKVKFIQICAMGTIRLSPIGPESFTLHIVLSYIKLDEDMHKFIRSVMSSAVTCSFMEISISSILFRLKLCIFVEVLMGIKLMHQSLPGIRLPLKLFL